MLIISDCPQSGVLPLNHRFGCCAVGCQSVLLLQALPSMRDGPTHLRVGPAGNAAVFACGRQTDAGHHRAVASCPSIVHVPAHASHPIASCCRHPSYMCSPDVRCCLLVVCRCSLVVAAKLLLLPQLLSCQDCRQPKFVVTVVTVAKMRRKCYCSLCQIVVVTLGCPPLLLPFSLLL